MTEATVTSCIFDACDFRGAHLGSATFSGSALRELPVRHDRLLSHHLPRVQADRAAPSPTRTCLSPSISGGDWSLVNLRSGNLRRLDLRSVRFGEADLYAANLTETDLREADLSGANLERARLTGADLRGARLDGINLPALDLHGVRLDLEQVMYLARCLGRGGGVTARVWVSASSSCSRLRQRRYFFS